MSNLHVSHSQFSRHDGVVTAKYWSLLQVEKLQQPTPNLEGLCLQGIVPAALFSGKTPHFVGSGSKVAALMRTYHIFHNSFICACCSFDEDLPYLPQLIHLRMLQLS